MTTPHCLLIGFSPFSHYNTNPAQIVTQQLASQLPHGSLTTSIFPVQQQGLTARLLQLIQQTQPDIIIGLGIAPCPTIQLERVGLNLADFNIPDTNGQQPNALPLFESAPDAYLSTLPLKPLQQHLLQQQLPTTISNSAGTYLCNQLLFTILHLQATHTPNAIGGFIHLPLSPQLVAEHLQQRRTGPPPPSMSIEQDSLAVSLAIQFLQNQPNP